MCTQKPPNDYSEQLYTRYRESFSVYIKERVKLFPTLDNSQIILQPMLHCAHVLTCACMYRFCLPWAHSETTTC